MTSHHLRAPFRLGQAAVKRVVAPRAASSSAVRARGLEASGHRSTQDFPIMALARSASRSERPASFTKRIFPPSSINFTQFDARLQKAAGQGGLARALLVVQRPRIGSTELHDPLATLALPPRRGPRAHPRHMPSRPARASGRGSALGGRLEIEKQCLTHHGLDHFGLERLGDEKVGSTLSPVSRRSG